MNLNSVGQIFIGCGQHEFDSVDLIYFAGARVVVDGYDVGTPDTVCRSSLITPLPTMWFGRQPKGWVQTIFRSALVDQFNHFTGQEPSFAGLVAQGDNRFSVFGKILDNGLLAEVLAVRAVPDGRFSGWPQGL